MANNFSTIKNDQASSKFYLVRIVPRRTVNDDLVLEGGGIYTMTFPYFPAGMTANGTSLTKVTTVTSSGEWSYNESTKELRVYSTPSSSNILVVDYYIFFTGGRHRVVNEDPEQSADPLRDWEPRIKSNPSIKASIENVIVGTFQISTTGISLINDNYEFHEYLTDNDSFNKSEIKIWLCLNDTENIQKVYDGTLRKLSLDDNSVRLQLEDPFGQLLDSALMGDDSSEVYYNRDDFPNVYPADAGRAIPYIIGTASRYLTIADTAISLSTAQKLDQTSLYQAVCTSYTNSISTSNNRTWGCCRVSSDGAINFGFTPSNIDNSAGTYTRLDGTAAQVDKFRIGDTFEITQGGSYYVRVLYVDRTNNYVYVTKEAAISTGAVVQSNAMPAIVITNESNETYYPLAVRDYDPSIVTTSGSNRYISIVFKNNFETNISGLTILDPGVYKVKYRARPDTTNAKHGSVIKSLLEKSGLNVDTNSITNANTSLDVNCNFSIPQFDEIDFNRYIDYIQLILKSAMSYVTLANDFEIEYYLINAPSSTDSVTDVDIIKDSLNIEIDYNDLVHQLIAFNPHFSSSEATEDTADSPSVTEENIKAKHLHNINRVSRFRHVLESMNSRLPDILAVRSERKAVYNFDTKAINLDNIVGDDINLTRTGILGGLGNKELKILSLNKSPKKVNILATDLLDL